MMEAMNVLNRGSKPAPQLEEKTVGGKWRRRHEIYAWGKQTSLYVMGDGKTITLAVSGSEDTLSSTGLAVNFGYQFTEDTMQRLLQFCLRQPRKSKHESLTARCGQHL